MLKEKQTQNMEKLVKDVAVDDFSEVFFFHFNILEKL